MQRLLSKSVKSMGSSSENSSSGASSVPKSTDFLRGSSSESAKRSALKKASIVPLSSAKESGTVNPFTAILTRTQRLIKQKVPLSLTKQSPKPNRNDRSVASPSASVTLPRSQTLGHQSIDTERKSPNVQRQKTADVLSPISDETSVSPVLSQKAVDVPTDEPRFSGARPVGGHPDSIPSLMWNYKDAANITHGPFDAVVILSWIRSGTFDDQHDVQFCPCGSSQFLSLTAALPALTQTQLINDTARLRRMRKPEKTSTAQQSLQPEILAGESDICKEYEGPLDLTKLPCLGVTDNAENIIGLADTELILLPPRTEANKETLPPSQLDTKDSDTGLVRSMESDSDWLLHAHPAFEHWATIHNFTGCRKALIIPVHSIVLKSASHILMEAFKKQETMQRRQDAAVYRTKTGRPPASDPISSSTTLKFYVRCIHPEAVRVILHFLYGRRTTFDFCEPVLLVCAYYEARRLGINTCANAVRSSVSRVRSVDALIAITELTEILELRDLFEECSAILCHCAYLVFTGHRYFQLGPLGLRRILASNSTSLDEVQLFVACHLWLLNRHKTKRLYDENFWKNAQAMEGRAESGSPHQEKPNEARKQEDRLDTDAMYEGKTRMERSFGNQVFIFSGIRFCHMSPDQLNEARVALHLDALLVDGLLRKLRGKEWPRRVAPWTSNSYFIVDRQDGSFPVTLRRVRHASTLGGYVVPARRSSAASTLRDPYVVETSAQARAHRTIPVDLFWAWTTGDPRPVTEACWATEVLFTKHGRLSLGVASAAGSQNTVLPGTTTAIPSHGSMVWYFNCQSREFYTGILQSDHRMVRSRLSMTPSGCDLWTRTVKRGDTLILRVSVGLTNLIMTVHLLGRNGSEPECTVAFNFPHRIPQQGKVGSRCILTLRPWYELLDFGDTLGLPEIGATQHSAHVV